MSEAAGANLNTTQPTDAERFAAIGKIAIDIGCAIYPLRELLRGPDGEGHIDAFLPSVLNVTACVLERLGCLSDQVLMLANAEGHTVCSPRLEDWAFDAYTADAVSKVVRAREALDHAAAEARRR